MFLIFFSSKILVHILGWILALIFILSAGDSIGHAVKKIFTDLFIFFKAMFIVIGQLILKSTGKLPAN